MSKSNWGGKRENSGRKKLIEKEEIRKLLNQIQNHATKKVSIAIKGSTKKVKKTRIIFLLDALFKEGIINNNVYAIKEYLDRAIGKSMQSVDMNIYDDSDNSMKLDLDIKLSNEELEDKTKKIKSKIKTRLARIDSIGKGIKKTRRGK